MPASGATPSGTSTGWQCPGCGKCYAPWVAACGWCPPARPAINTNPIPPYPAPSPNQRRVTAAGRSTVRLPDPDDL